jgi:hypothetical protein
MNYDVIHYNSRLWVTRDGRPLCGYTTNELRSYVFPLYTPLGALVLQEAPPDHPHHQGVWAGLEVDGCDLWNAGSFGVPRNRQELVGQLTEIGTSIGSDGVRLNHAVRWMSLEGRELMREERRLRLGAASGATVLEWQSVFSHPDKNVRLGQTKESGLALRVPPHWETRFGGRIRDAQGGTGEAGCFDQMSPWLNVEGTAGADHTAGVVLVPTTAPCPWFARDYGIHIYNPARQGAIELAPGETLTWSMRVLAYDGARTVAAVNALVGAVS